MTRCPNGSLLLGLMLLVFLPGNQSLARDSQAKWVAVASIDAPEAHQAAAADEKHAYAITNSKIAKYDRETAELLAVSSGKAQHLNSGFFWRGKLYCAHSNYPQLPEQSDIKVLDPATMQISTIKDFGNFGGSLTWAVHHDDHWWCNFARYGDVNSETFLVKFDSEWMEQGRWTYPKAVIHELQRYSISGGIWYEGEILASGHDRGTLYRLRIPEAGSVLELSGKDSVPFTGQGFALDPSGQMLVGIHRAKRKIVFAALEPVPQQLRVLSYNIHHGEGVDGKLDLQRIADVIQAAEPDIVALQEVDNRVDRSDSVDQAAILAELTRMTAVFGSNIPLQGGNYGNAVLSKHPILRHENHALPSFDNGEQRGVLEVQIDIPGDSPVVFFATHLDHRQPDAERRESAKRINEIVKRHDALPAILAGDLNDVPGSETLRILAELWAPSSDEQLPTIPVARPVKQIDFILVRSESRWKVVDTRVLDEAVASDHRPILAVLELTAPSSRANALKPSESGRR